MASRPKNLLKEVQQQKHPLEDYSDNNKVNVNIKVYNDNHEEKKKEEEEESEYEDEEEEEDDDEEEEESEKKEPEKKINNKNEENEDNVNLLTKRNSKEIQEDDNKKENNNNVNEKNFNKIEEKNVNNNNDKNDKTNCNNKDNKDNNKDNKDNNNNDNNNKDNNNNNDNNNEKKNENNTRQKTKPPTIKKFNMAKSSSTSNYELNNNNITFQANEIRQNDLFENKRVKNQINDLLKNKKNNNCYKCGTTNIEESTSITFSCNHISCYYCIIKDLILLQFKNIENKNKIQLNCSCMVGTSHLIEFSELLQKIKYANSKKEEKHKCQQHEIEGKKYCKECELWLCNECINIHSIFNKEHSLTDNSVPLKTKCKNHNNEFTQYYCLNCKEEICPICITRNGRHSDHNSIKFDKFINYAKEIKSKLKFKTYDECLLNLDNIKQRNDLEKKRKIENFQEKINDLINKINITKDNYIKEINDKIDYLNQAIDIIKECYKYFYLILSSDKKDYNDLDFLRQIKEIDDIKTDYYNYKEISKITKIFENFNLDHTLFSYNIKIDEVPFRFSTNFEKIFKKKFIISHTNINSPTSQSKYNLNLIKYKEIKYEKTIKTKKGTIYSIIKINNEKIAFACEKEILIINDINNINEISYFDDGYDSLKGHTKNVLCLTLLSENKLISGSEDKSIKIWDIDKKNCIETISGNFQRIDSLLNLKNNILIIGTYNLIKIINIETKEEISTLVGHEKSICSIISLKENILISSSYDNSIKIWNMNTKECEYSLYGHDSAVFCILILKDGRLISGSGSWNKSLKIWNLEKKICECSLIGHKREVRDIKQLNNGCVISASMDKTIKVWNIHKKICIQTLISHYDVIFSLCIIDKKRFVSGGRDQDIIIWNY